MSAKSLGPYSIVLPSSMTNLTRPVTNLVPPHCRHGVNRDLLQGSGRIGAPSFCSRSRLDSLITLSPHKCEATEARRGPSGEDQWCVAAFRAVAGDLAHPKQARGLDWPSRNAHRVSPCAQVRPTWAPFDSVTKSFGAPVCAILVIGVVSMGGSWQKIDSWLPFRRCLTLVGLYATR